jgi:hypothetical protein
MERQEETRRRSLLRAGGGALAVAALLVVWALGSAGQASAEPIEGLDFNMSVGGFSSCNSTQGDTQCYIPPGTTFTLSITLEPLPFDVEFYQGFDVTLEYSGLTSLDNASVEAWPDCAFPATGYEEAGQIAMGCAIGVKPAPPSTYTGLMATTDFTCSGSGFIRMVHGSGWTDLLQDVNVIWSEPGEAETLNIVCGSPPTATPPPLPTIVPSGSAGALGESDTSGNGLWLAMGALLALTGTAAGLSWAFARNRR